MEITRDLVFGVMALQKSLINASQLAQAMAAHCKTREPLPDVIVGEGWMDRSASALLQEELDRELQDHGGDLQRLMNKIGASPVTGRANDTVSNTNSDSEPVSGSTDSRAMPLDETVDASDPTVARQRTTTSPGDGRGSASSTYGDGNSMDGDLDETTSLHSTEGHVDIAGDGSQDPFQVKTVEFTPEQCARYTLTRIHGEGGLGQVWLAIDPNLNREVALKNIRPGKDGRVARQRLIREAQITGQLEHPNIIPVYELEQASLGTTPYYTMRFLRGETLQQRISAYHKHRKAGKVDPLELPELLNAFIDICHAMAYAASRGVMHRDLKPQNIMVGDFGEVLILDWGLAKKIGEEELSSPDDRAAIKLAPASEDSQTAIGQVMGSPAYMAPEQATGRIDLMDARTDIYGLGAILFAILTGKGPHRGERTGNTAKDTMALLERISTGETPRVRSFDPAIPRPLDEICSRAMARERADRYQNATELARDVQRFLADEPVSVYVEPWQQRTWRWMRRHRAWTQSLAVALILTMVVAVIASLIVDQARRKEKASHEETVRALAAEKNALAEANSAKQEATLRFRQARRAVDESFTGISQSLLNYPGVQQLRTQLLQNAAREYQRFAAERSDDPELRLEFATALVRLGDVRRLLADFSNSQQAYHRAIALFDEFLEQDPASSEVRLALAQCHNSLGMLHVTVGSLPDAGGESEAFVEAEKAYETAQALLGKNDAASKTPEFRRTQAQTLANQGVLSSRKSEPALAIDALQEAADVFEKLSNELNDPHDLSELAKTRIAIGELLVQTGRSPEAEKELKDAIVGYEDLVRQEPGEPRYLQGLADARITLANVLRALGRTLDRIALYESSVTDYAALMKTRPDVPMYRERLASTAINLSQVLNSLGRNEEAKTQAEVALDLAIDLVLENSDVAQYHALETYGLVTLGQVLRDLQELVLAETAFTKAVEIATMLITVFPNQARYIRLRGEIANNMGTVHLLNKNYTAARQTFNDARSDLDKVLELVPEDAYAQDGLAWTLTYLGDTLRLLERATEAKTFYQSALELHHQGGPEPHRQYQLAWFLVNCQEPEFWAPDEAAVIAERLSKLDPTNANYLVLQAAAWYRKEAWQQCLAKLDQAAIVKLRGKNPIDFWRAMALHRQSPTDPEAKLIFDRACAQLEKQAPGDLKLVRLRDEARMLFEPTETPDDP